MDGSILSLFDEKVHTIPRALYNIQMNFGNRPANLFKEGGKWRVITYNDLLTGVENLAMGLIKLGINPGDFVGVKACNSARWTWADLGSVYAGAVSVSIYPSLSATETIAVANHSGVKLLFVESRQAVQDISAHRSDIPSLQYLVCLEKSFHGNDKNIFGFGELIGMGAAVRQEHHGQLKARLKSLQADSPAMLVYTSGSVDNLKAALFSHQDILDSCTRIYRHFYNYGRIENSEMVSLVYLPLSHIMEKIHGYLGPMLLGGTLGFVSAPENILTDMTTIRPNWVTWVPRIASTLFLGFQKAFMATKDGRMAWEKAVDVAVRTTAALQTENGFIDTTIPIEQQLQGALREEWLEAYNTVYWRIHHALGGRLQTMIIGGAYMDSDLQAKLVGMGFNIMLGYGLTESGSGIAVSCPNRYKIACISPPCPGVEFRREEDGELLIRGQGIIREYFRNKDADRESFTPDGWFKTGDIVEIDADGYIRIVDRKKLMIVLDNGKNVAQARIEALCAGSGLIDQVAIVGQDREYIGALIVPNFNFIIRVLRNHGIPFDECQLKHAEIDGIHRVVEVGDDIIDNDFVKMALQDQIDIINAKLKSYESIRAFRLLNRRFSEENGEVTPSQKTRVKVILEKYKDLIDEMY
ncbi:AMP-dependent synthetase/ligase [Syntrophomonas curvata]